MILWCCELFAYMATTARFYSDGRSCTDTIARALAAALSTHNDAEPDAVSEADCVCAPVVLGVCVCVAVLLAVCDCVGDAAAPLGTPVNVM